MGKYDEEEDIAEEELADDEPYSQDALAEAVEEDEIDDIEEGFMEGYEEGERAAKCALCKKLLDADFIEEEIEGKVYRFCSETHAEAFSRKQAEELDED